jgi:hypothetical protein
MYDTPTQPILVKSLVLFSSACTVVYSILLHQAANTGVYLIIIARENKY